MSPALPPSLTGKTALITGAARRVGAAIARLLHAEGANLVIHYRHSAQAAQILQDELHSHRPGSVALVAADLLQTTQLPDLMTQACAAFGQLDLLINNASSFYPTPIGTVTELQWDDLIGSNLKAPFFLAQAAAPALKLQQGCIINIVDIHAERPLAHYPVYCMAKAGLAMMTKALARELGPHIRVNGVSPGAILWPEEGMDPALQQRVIARTALKRVGDPLDIAQAVLFLSRDATYITGQILAVDGGRSIVL